MTKILVSVAALTITRDAMTILPAAVPAHEVEITKAVFGEDNVEVHEDAKTDPIEIDSSIEHERLEAKYGPDALSKAYGTNYKSNIAKAVKEHEAKAAKTIKAAA